MTDALTPEEKAEYEGNLAKVDWELPRMETFDKEARRWITQSILDGDIVEAMCCLGWGFWPTKNRGYYDEYHLRKIADFLEIQNKPFWDDYERWCDEHPPELEGDELCLDELGFTPIPTSSTKECVGSPDTTAPS